MSAQVEQWRVTTPEGVFETDLETLQQWIVEGCVLPTDKVSKGKHNWIEAGRAPMLRAAFKGETPVADAAAVTAAAPENVTASSPTDPSPGTPSTVVVADHTSSGLEREGAAFTGPFTTPSHNFITPSADVCHNHPEVRPKYVCRACATPFCEECTRLVSTSSIPICGLCGELCRLFAEEQKKVFHAEFQSSGFGFKDFGRALRYPLQHKIALLFGAGLYGFLQLAGFRGRLIAFVIMFGCISHVIGQVAWGKLNRSFLPDFSAFNVLDDLVVPIFLGVGIVIVTWGPVIVFALALIFSVISGPKAPPSRAAFPPGVQQSGVTPEELAVLTSPNPDPQKLEEITNKLNQTRPDAQLARAAQESKPDPMADAHYLLGFLRLPWFILLALVLSLVWAVFYGPMALAVAGYTQQFTSVINPLVGLDTIRRMGGTYFKAFGMVIVVQIVGIVVSIVLGMILAPFDMPFFGNLPANFIDGSVSFYFNLVVACVLGLSLHKCADRLGIEAK
jgi:hypothetical protein